MLLGEAGFRESIGSFLRRKRVVHPNGGLYRATIEITHPLPLLEGTALGRPDRLRALARFSHGFGFGPGRADSRGLALRIFDAGGVGRWDLLLLTTVEVRGRQRFVLRRSYGERFCSIAPLAAPRGTVVFHVLPAGLCPSDEVIDGGGGEGLVWQLFAGPPRRPWYPCATMTLGRPLDAELSRRLRFNPHHADLGLVPVGAFNAARAITYPASQLGRWWWDRAQRPASQVSPVSPGSTKYSPPRAVTQADSPLTSTGG